MRTSEIQALIKRLAVEHCWNAIDSSSVTEQLDGVEWMNVGEDAQDLGDMSSAAS